MRFLSHNGWEAAGGEPNELSQARAERFAEIIKFIEKNKRYIDVIDGESLNNTDFNNGEEVSGFGIDTFLITSEGKLAIVSNR